MAESRIRRRQSSQASEPAAGAVSGSLPGDLAEKAGHRLAIAGIAYAGAYFLAYGLGRASTDYTDLSVSQPVIPGLGIYVADLIMIGFSRELAVLMTAVVVSARTGAAIAAELSTMKVQDELNALRGMGLNVPQFLVAPKLGALIVVLPCLTILGLIAGILGGMLWGITVQGYQMDLWVQHTLDAAAFRDLFQGLIKSFFFAIVIVLVGCHNGFRVEGGSRGVGLMTTRAVVMDIFFIIVIDMLCATVFYYVLGW